MSIETTQDLADQGTGNVVDKAATAADGAIRKTQAATNVAFDRMADGVGKARESASPMLDDLASKTDQLKRDGLEVAKARAAQLREQALQLSDTASERIREEPLKAVLIAAAVGLLAGLLMNRPRYPNY